MTPREKIDAAVAELRERKVRATTAAPHLYRLAWALGFHPPPPLFQSFLGILFFQGTWFGVAMWLMLVIGGGNWDRFDTIGLAIGAGVFFGVCTGVYFRGYARRLGLPRWADYSPGALTDEEDDW